MRLFYALVTWHSASDGTMLSSITAEQRKKAFQQLAGRFLPTAVRNVFEKKTALCSDTTAFQLHKRPNYAEASIDETQDLFCLRNFREDLRSYFLGSRARQDTPLPFSLLSIWDRVRIQRASRPEGDATSAYIEVRQRNTTSRSQHQHMTQLRQSNTYSNALSTCVVRNAD